MNNQWMLYASIITGVSFILLYVAINHDHIPVVNLRTIQLNVIKSWKSSNSSSYEGELNALSQQVSVSNRSYEDSVEWIFRSDLSPEEGITLQGYAMGWDFYEAQTCATRNLVGLQRWATSLDFGVVEPFVIESYFRTYRFKADGALRLRDYFDIDVWNHKVMTTIPSGTPLVKWEDFIKKAARQLVVVHVMMRASETKVYVGDDVKKGICFSGRGFTNSTLKDFGFKVVRNVCFKFNTRSPMPIDELNKNILGPFKANNVSIVFTFVPGVNRARINILQEKYHQGFVDWLKPSKRVINDAKKYIDMYLGTNYVAVSVRAFKIGVSLRSHKPANIREATKVVVCKCVDEIAQTLSSLPGQHFMTADIGTFGDPKALSFISNDIGTQIINKMINVTYHNSWHKAEWEDTFVKATGGISDSGYIASVQKEIVSHGSTIIVAGGGTFQSSMLLQHKSQTTQKHDVLQVCSIGSLYEAYKAEYVKA